MRSNRLRQHFTDAPESHVSKGITTIVQRYQLVTFCTRTFSNHDHGIAWQLRSSSQRIDLAESRAEQLENSPVSERMFRDEDHVRLSRDSRPEREMSGVPAHHLDHLHPTMRARRCARSFEHFRDVSQRRVKTECVIGAGEIFINRLGNTNNAHALLRETGSNTERVFAAAGNERIKFQALDVFDYFRRTIRQSFSFKRIRARRAEIRAPIPIPTTHCFATERQRVRQRIQKAAPAIK